MWVPADLPRLLRATRALLTERLAEPDSPQNLLLKSVTPLAAIRAIADFLRSSITGDPIVGLILGTGSFALQVGTWLGLSIALPALARQFHTQITERQAFVLSTYAMTPLWLAGFLHLVPEEPNFLFFWSRSLVAVVGASGLVIAHRGILALGVRRSMRMPLLGAIAGAAAVLYATLFVLLGIGAHIVIFLVG